MTGFAPISLGYFNKDVVNAYELAQLEAKELGHPAIDSDHLLLGIIRQRNNLAADLLAKAGLGFGKLPELRVQVKDLLPQRVSFDGHDIDDIRPSMEVLHLLELGRLKMIRENPAASEKRLANVIHLLRAILLTQTANPQMRMLLYAQGNRDRRVRPAMRLLQQNGVDTDQLRAAAEAQSGSWF